MKRQLITFPTRLEEMVQELKDEKGYASTTAVVHAGLIELHTKAFPNYMRKPPSTGVERVRVQQDTKKAKEDAAEGVFRELSDALGGKIVVEGGKSFCVYFTYTGKKRFEQKVPLELLSTDLVKTQYQPSKEKVLKLQAEGKTDYSLS